VIQLPRLSCPVLSIDPSTQRDKLFHIFKDAPKLMFLKILGSCDLGCSTINATNILASFEKAWLIAKQVVPGTPFATAPD
jgi:hypothetical protein